MAEYSANALQTLTDASPALIFTETPVPCTKGLIFHRDETPNFTLASPSRINGKVWGGCRCNRRMLEAQYEVAFHANIAVSEGGTVGPISLAIAIDGNVDPSSTMIVTPAAAQDFFNVGAEIVVSIPAICGCDTISIVKTSTGPVDVQNANLVINMKGIA